MTKVGDIKSLDDLTAEDLKKFEWEEVKDGSRVFRATEEKTSAWVTESDYSQSLQHPPKR